MLQYVTNMLSHSYAVSSETIITTPHCEAWKIEGKMHTNCIIWGTLCRSWLRHCATSRIAVGSVPNKVIGISHRHNPSGRTMASGSTETLAQMSKGKVIPLQARCGPEGG